VAEFEGQESIANLTSDGEVSGNIIQSFVTFVDTNIEKSFLD